MKFLKWGVASISLLIISLIILSTHPKVSNQLSLNFKKNLSRSFRDSGMGTQLEKLDLSIWPLKVNWSLLKIYRNTLSELPNSWIHIFQSINLKECRMKIFPYWFEIQLGLNCSKIELQYIPLKWIYVASLKSEYALDFFFTNSDFNNFQTKQGWFKANIKADKFFINGEELGKLNLRYNFISQTEFESFFPDSKEKITFRNEPEMLEIFSHRSRKKFAILNKSIYLEIMKVK